MQISIHALREEGDDMMLGWAGIVKISIHALREEGDVYVNGFAHILVLFLSTPSARRATLRACNEMDAFEKFLSTPSARRATIRSRNGGVDRGISIHALREEGDMFMFWALA